MCTKQYIETAAHNIAVVTFLNTDQAREIVKAIVAVTCSGWLGRSKEEKKRKAKSIADLIMTLKEKRETK